MLRVVQLIRFVVRFIVWFVLIERQFIWLEQRLVIEFLGIIVRLVLVDRQQLVRQFVRIVRQRVVQQ